MSSLQEFVMIGKLQRFSHFIPKKIPFGLTDGSALVFLVCFFCFFYLFVGLQSLLRPLYVTFCHIKTRHNSLL